jgi:hypothetical protein
LQEPSLKEEFLKTKDVCLSAFVVPTVTQLVCITENQELAATKYGAFCGLGMNFEMDSQPSSKGFSSSWANKLPRLMKRRGAFPKFDSESTARGRHSVESDVGISFRK